MRRNQFRIWTMIGSTALLCVGCGPVNLSTMAPNVWKPSALFILDGRVAGWRPSEVHNLATQSGVVTEAVYVSHADVQRRLNSSITLMPRVGLYVVVSNSEIPNSISHWATSHLQKRVEWIGPSSTQTDDINLRQLTADGPPAAYLLGWMASYSASQQGGGTATVGWDITPSSDPMSVTEIRAALGGSYVANAAVKNVPLSLEASALAVVPAVLPKYIVVNHPLTSAEATLVAQSGSVIVSLVPQTASGYVLAACPGVPGPQAALPDLLSYKHLSWKAGQGEAAQGPWIQVDGQQVSGPIQSQVASQETVLQSDPEWATSAWTSVPAQIRQTWAAISG